MDRADIDEFGKGRLYFGKSMIVASRKIEGQPNVYLLETNLVSSSAERGLFERTARS